LFSNELSTTLDIHRSYNAVMLKYNLKIVAELMIRLSEEVYT